MVQAAQLVTVGLLRPHLKQRKRKRNHASPRKSQWREQLSNTGTDTRSIRGHRAIAARTSRTIDRSEAPVSAGLNIFCYTGEPFILIFILISSLCSPGQLHSLILESNRYTLFSLKSVYPFFKLLDMSSLPGLKSLP